MKIFTISDLHLAFSNKKKSMEFFGPTWKNYTNKIKNNWIKKISKEDLILIPGDISWSLKIEDALLDLNWIDSLPGKKIILKGNHDYFWDSLSKLKKHLPPSITPLQNNAINIEDISIVGTKLYDSLEYNFNKIIDYVPNENQKAKDIQKDQKEKIFFREVERFKLSLKGLNENARLKIALFHYPPISYDLKPSIISNLLEENKIDIVIFGHLHNVKKDIKIFGIKNNIKYILASADYIEFDPLEII